EGSTRSDLRSELGRTQRRLSSRSYSERNAIAASTVGDLLVEKYSSKMSTRWLYFCRQGTDTCWVTGTLNLSLLTTQFSMIKEADMSTVMLMEWTGVTQDQYNQVMRTLDLDKNPAAGAILHVAGFTAGTLHVLDVWESQQAFEKFQKDRLAAAVQEAGINSQPKVQFYPARNI